jgi:hypothetical protein
MSETKSIAERVAREWYQELPFVYKQDGINALAQRIQAAIDEALGRLEMRADGAIWQCIRHEYGMAWKPVLSAEQVREAIQRATKQPSTPQSLDEPSEIAKRTAREICSGSIPEENYVCQGCEECESSAQRIQAAIDEASRSGVPAEENSRK